MPVPILGAYAASKHAVKGFTDSLRQELIEEGAPVYVTLIKPAGIHTPFGNHSKNYMDSASWSRRPSMCRKRSPTRS